MPVLRPHECYPHLGLRRCANGDHALEVKHVAALCTTLIERPRHARIAGSEWQAAIQGSVGGVFAYHGAGSAALADVAVAEDTAERRRRSEYRRKFHAANVPNYEFYTTMRWVHVAAEAAASLHAQWTELLALPFDCDLRRVARSQLALTLDQLGCRSDPLTFDFSHLIGVMGRAERGRYWQCAKWLSILGRCLVAEGKPCTIGQWVGSPADREGDVLDEGTNARWRRSHGGGELFRGELLEARAVAAGIQREPNVLLLRAGVSVVAHACNVDTVSFMNWSEARWAWPLLRDAHGGEKAWTRLMSDLELMGVQPVPGLREHNAETLHKIAGGAHGQCSHDAAAARPSEAEVQYAALVANLAEGGEPATQAQWQAAIKQAWFKGATPQVRDPHDVKHFTATPAELYGGARITYRLPAKGLTRGARTPTLVTGGQARRHSDAREEACDAEAEADMLAAVTAAVDAESSFSASGDDEAMEDAMLYGEVRDTSTSAAEAAQAHATARDVHHSARPHGEGATRAATRSALAVMEEGCDEWRRQHKTEPIDDAMSKCYLTELEERQMEQGWEYDAVVAVDGGWQRGTDVLTCGVVIAYGPRSTRAGEFETLALRLETDDENANNFDTELLARMIALEHTSSAGAQRVLVVFDATSPVAKTLQFRRQDVRARGRCARDEWLATTIVLEDEHDEVHYDWVRSHTQSKMPLNAKGSYLYNVIADALCGQAEANKDADLADVPERTPRHRSMRFVARASERRWLLERYNKIIADSMRGEGQGVIRADDDDFDCLRSCGVPAGLRKQVVQARCGDVRLLGCEPRWRGQAQAKRFRRATCPCGGGQQTLAHVVFDCCLPAVQIQRHYTARAMRAAKVDAQCAEWWELTVALEGSRTVVGTTREARLTRAALGVMLPHPALTCKPSLACAAKGSVAMVRAAEAATAEERLRTTRAAVHTAMRRRVLTAWRAVAEARPATARADATEARQTQLRWLAAHMGGGLGVAHARRLLAEKSLGEVATALASRAKTMWVRARATWDGGGEDDEVDHADARRRAEVQAGFAQWRLRHLLEGDAWRDHIRGGSELRRVGGLGADFLTDEERRLQARAEARRADIARSRVRRVRQAAAEVRQRNTARRREALRRRRRTPAQVEAERAAQATVRRQAANERRRERKRAADARTPATRDADARRKRQRAEERVRSAEQEEWQRQAATRAYDEREAAARDPMRAAVAALRWRPAWATRRGEAGSLARSERAAAAAPAATPPAAAPRARARGGLGSRIRAIAAATGVAAAADAALRHTRQRETHAASVAAARQRTCPHPVGANAPT